MESPSKTSWMSPAILWAFPMTSWTRTTQSMRGTGYVVGLTPAGGGSGSVVGIGHGALQARWEPARKTIPRKIRIFIDRNIGGKRSDLEMEKPRNRKKRIGLN